VVGGLRLWRFLGRRRAEAPLSERARELLARVWEGIDPARQLDSHVHLVGVGAGGTGCYVNPRMRQKLRHPMLAAELFSYERAGGIDDDAQADQQYAQTLLRYVRSPEMRGRCLLLAFDEVYDEEGARHPEDTEFFTPNGYVLDMARKNPDCFLPAASIHPYRKDCLEELDRVAKLGAVAVKWLPNAQRIDPASSRCDPFFERLAALKLPLLSHAGEESAVQSAGAQQLGNPLRFRRALDHGVKVILAHCASLGTSPDLDAPGQPERSNLELFLRLMAEPRYSGRLFGDISALAQINRCRQGLKEVLAHADLHERLINGSDYPLPGINFLVSTAELEALGFLTGSDRVALDELHARNPLAFDFALKRCVKIRTPSGEMRFPASVFMSRQELFGA
jgi:predicted TIM-barrel fold metal-dependent hydrolase